jgi:hypothetical protein
MTLSKTRSRVDVAAIFRKRAEILERWRTRGIGEHLNNPRATDARIVVDGVLRMQRAEEHSQNSRQNQDRDRFFALIMPVLKDE